MKLILSKDSRVSGVNRWNNKRRGTFRILNASTLSIANTTKVDADIYVDSGSQLIIEEECKIENVSLVLSDKSKVVIKKGTILNASGSKRININASNGKIIIGEYCNLLCDMASMFNAELIIGNRTSIGANSEICAHESVVIGQYCLFSYDVCIYDTDSHSLDWKDRRERIEQCYPNGVGEIQKPGTRPVLIGDDVWIGKGATVTKGTQIGDRCIIGIRTSTCGEIFEPDTVVVSDKPRIIKKKL